MTNLTNNQVGATYSDLMTLGNDLNPGIGLTTTLVNVQDGNGVNSPMQISTTTVNFSTNGGNLFKLNGITLTATATQLNALSGSIIDFSFNTEALRLPVGTTAQRPVGAIGDIRYNSDGDLFEGYRTSGGWNTFFTGSILSIANLLSLSTSTPIFNSTSAVLIPSGTTVQRPSVPIAGQIRYNTDGGGPEVYIAGSINAWQYFFTGTVLQFARVLLLVDDTPIFNSTTAVTVPLGNTAQRPGSPNAGQFRFNSQTSVWEGYDGATWRTFTVT